MARYGMEFSGRGGGRGARNRGSGRGSAMDAGFGGRAGSRGGMQRGGGREMDRTRFGGPLRMGRGGMSGGRNRGDFGGYGGIGRNEMTSGGTWLHDEFGGRGRGRGEFAAYDQDLGGRMRQGWSQLRSRARQWMGRGGYDRSW